jgi:hypothetical protein
VVAWPVLAGLLLAMLLALPAVLPARRNPPWPTIAAYLDATQSGVPVRTAEPWITGPLGFYRHAGAVLPAEEAGAQPLPMVCRRLNCHPQDLGDGMVLVKTWTWGSDPGANELRLYAPRAP